MQDIDQEQRAIANPGNANVRGTSPQHALVLDECDDLLHSLPGLEIAEHEGFVAAHALRV